MSLRLVSLVVVAALLVGCGQEAVVTGPSPPVAPPAKPPAAPGASPAAAYPLDTCVISGDTLGKMGDPVVVTREGVEIHLCCGDCIKELDKDPKKYAGMVKAAMRK